MSNYYCKQAGTTTHPAPAYSPEKFTFFRSLVDFADLRTSTAAAHTTGVVATDHIIVATIPKGAVLFSLGLYTLDACGAQTIDLADGTNTFISNGSIAVADTFDVPDTNPMAQYTYTADTALYINADGTITSGQLVVFGAYYLAVDDNDMA